MLNVYGYTYKTVEEDEKILAAVRKHHDAVVAKGYLVVFTSLVGSQNYDLDDEQSDIDTYSFIYPALNDIAQGKDMEAGVFEMPDGLCNYKDIRTALNLLKKTSPNSVEYFSSKYKIYNPVFEPLLREYLEDNTRMWMMERCNYEHMIYAIAGMAHQLTKRNMDPGKRFTHMIRLDDMYYHMMNAKNSKAVIELCHKEDSVTVCKYAKRNNDPDDIPKYNMACEAFAEKMDRIKSEFKLTPEQALTQERGMALINSLQWKLFKLYMETYK